MDAIERHKLNVKEALLAMLALWRKSNCSPYLWKILLKVLATNSVGHHRLADDIARRLSGKTADSVFCMCIHRVSVSFSIAFNNYIHTYTHTYVHTHTNIYIHA